jgi:hypothetical protein
MKARHIAALILAGMAAGVLSAQSPYTHYVTPFGTSTTCAEAAPCNLWMASQVAFPAGSVVRVAAGEYSHGQLTFGRSGTAAAPLTFSFEAGARLSGTRDKPATWTPTPGYPHVYETTECGLTPCASVGTVAQRSPASWTPILVDDRLPPFTASLGRPFTLDIPPPFKRVPTLAEVEAQHGTFLETATKVHVHTYHDGMPTPADDLYVAPLNWGSIRIEGDYLTFDGLTIEKTSSTGLHVRPSAAGTVLRNITARAAQVWLEGLSTIAEDLDVSHVLQQGVPTATGAYDANPGFGIGENWNSGGQGYALLIGRAGSTAGGWQTVRRARVHRSWNGVEINGRNTIEHSWVWGFPNHAMGGGGTGLIIRDNVVANGQDSLFMSGDTFDQLTVEHNAFVNAVLITASTVGRPTGAAPTTWTFRGNILPALSTDDRSLPAMTSGCNVYIPKSADPSHVVKITSTVGGQAITYHSVGGAQTAGLESQSIEMPFTFWTDGRAFVRYLWQSDPAIDLSDPLKVCGERAGPR